MVLVSTVVARLGPIPFNRSILFLITAIAITYLLTVELLLHENIFLKLMISILFVGIPIFFCRNLFCNSI